MSLVISLIDISYRCCSFGSTTRFYLLVSFVQVFIMSFQYLLRALYDTLLKLTLIYKRGLFAQLDYLFYLNRIWQTWSISFCLLSSFVLMSYSLPCTACVYLNSWLLPLDRSYCFSLLLLLNLSLESECGRQCVCYWAEWCSSFHLFLCTSISNYCNVFKSIIQIAMRRLVFLALLILATQQLSLCPAGSNSTSCLPCLANCTTCSTQFSCTLCQIQYYQASTGSCGACPQNCKQCSSSLVCTTCSNPYVLVNQSCSLCVIDNAVSCSSTVAASSCASGYYLSGGYCNSCMLNCVSCSSAFDCSACTSNYYLNQTILTCNPCPPGCSACDQYTTACTTCQNGYALNGQQCSVVSCGISNCLYCSSGGVCQQCSMFYYWDGSGCRAGASVTCEGGANGALPNNCANSCSKFGFVSGNNSGAFRCKPHRTLYVDPVEYHQRYFYAFNDVALFNAACNANLSLTVVSNGEYAYPLAGTMMLSEVPNYYRVVIRLKYMAITGIALTLTATTPTTTQTEVLTLQSSSQASSVELSTSIVHSYNLNMTTNGTVQLLEVLLRYYKCASGCSVCLNRQLCQLCDAPDFMLSYGCVANCSVYVHFLPNRTCLNSCPDQYYQTTNNTLRYCTACASPCLTCSSASLCLSCATPYFYYNYTCSLTCPTSYYPSGTLCQPCVSPCATCTSQTNCLSCSQGYWNGTACASSCASGTFADSSTATCSPCASSCLTCINSASSCTSCLTPRLYYNYQCLTACPDRYYSSGGQCLECLPPCYLCASSTSCLSCAYNYLLNHTCSPSCPSNYFPDQALLQCTPCQTQCLTCASAYSCTACAQGCLYSGQCPSVCPSTALFAQNSSGVCVCQSCLYPCSTCTNATLCLSCVDGYLFGGSCLVQCPSGYYPSSANATCTLCNSTFANCLNCSSSACTLCATNYYLLHGSCLSVCPSGYYPSSQQCQLCVAPCLTCTDTSACLSCVWPYALLGTACVSDCASDQIILTVSNITQCVSCTAPCLSCSVDTTNCTYCRYGYYLHNYQCLSNCSTLLPTNTYYSEAATLTCQACAFPCLTCTSQTGCLSCRVGYFNPVLFTCTTCSLGTYPLNSTCQSCPSSCSICYSSTFCAACTTGYYLYLNSCVSNTSICQVHGYYVSGQVCYSCLQPCATCWVSAQNCTSCLSGYIFSLPNTCLVSCPSGYYQANSSCLPCSAVCTTCLVAADHCLSCAAGYYLLLANASCLATCPATTYLAGSACSLCQYPCLACSSELVCLSCVTGVLIGSQCYSSCLSGYFATNSTCQSCTAPCSECSQVSTNCTQCSTGHWLLNGTCLSACPSLYFPQSESAQCLKCVGLCLECSSYINCTSCNSSYIYFFSVANQVGECVLSCPSAYYPTNNTCGPCMNTCLTCSDATSCLTCALLVQYQGQCLTDCPALMYSLDGVCANCSFPCSNCTGPYTCTSCPSTYLLVAGSSCFPGPNCPSGYYLYTDQCLSRCPSNYYNLPNGTCNNISCGDNYFMGADMYCYTTCPSGYIANASYYCYYCPNCPALYFSLAYSIIRDSLYLYLTFTQTPNYAFVPRIVLTPPLPYESINFPTTLVGGTAFSGSTNMTFLLPLNYSLTSKTLTVAFQDQMATFSNPLQSPNATLQLAGYDYYPADLSSLPGVGILALVVALLGLGKNPFMTDFAQMLFLVGLVDCHYPSNLAGLLQSAGLAHLHRWVSLSQPGQVGSGKFLYLTGTGFLSNVLTNLCVVGGLLGAAGVVWLVVAVLRRRMTYSKVHQQAHQEKLSDDDKNIPCAIQALTSFFQHFHWRCFLRIVYFNYAVLSLFALLQLTNFDGSEPVNAAAGAAAAVVVVLLVFYPLYIRENKPKYTFLMLRKLLISGAVVLSLRDAIYAIGIMSVCNFTAVVLLYTYKLEKYRYQTRLLALFQLLQLLVMIALCFFIIIGEGNSTSSKLTLCSIIIVLIVIILVLYLLQAVSQLFFWIYLKAKGEDLRAEWRLNSSLDEQESHHSESINGSAKDKQEQPDETKKPLQTRNLETMLVQIKQEMRVKAEKEMQRDYFDGQNHSKPENRPNQTFWAYTDSQKDENQMQKSAPKLLVRCVNEFSDLDGGSQGGV